MPSNQTRVLTNILALEISICNSPLRVSLMDRNGRAHDPDSAVLEKLRSLFAFQTARPSLIRKEVGD